MLPVPYSVLVDSPTSSVLILSQSAPIVWCLSKYNADTQPYTYVNYPHYVRDFPFARCPPVKYPEWTWVVGKRLFEPTPPNLLTDELRRASALAVKKAGALEDVMRVVSIARYPVWRGVLLQEQVYVVKQAQAQRYKDEGYPDNVLPYPYVLQYADYSGLSPREAADEILFKARLDDEHLVKTEAIRLRYFDRIRDAKNLDDMVPILADFKQEIFGASMWRV